MCVQLDDCVLCRIHNKAAKQNPRAEEGEEEDGEKMNEENDSNPSPSQVIMSGGGDGDMKIDSNYYDQDGDEGYLQNFLGVLEQGEPPSMEDILQPQPQAQAFGVQGLIFDASASTAGVQGFDASASTSTSAASQNNNSNIYTNTNFSTSASTSQNNNSHICTTNFSDKGPTF